MSVQIPAHAPAGADVEGSACGEGDVADIHVQSSGEETEVETLLPSKNR